MTWGALTLTLTLLGGAWTWYAFRHRGLVSGLRGAAFTLLPLAAYLTKTLRMFTRIADAVTDWAVSLAFNPLVWGGVVLAGVSVVLFVVAGALAARGIGGGPKAVARGSTGKRSGESAGPGELDSGTKGRGRTPTPSGDPELDDIEALLRKRGIS